MMGRLQLNTCPSLESAIVVHPNGPESRKIGPVATLVLGSRYSMIIKPVVLDLNAKKVWVEYRGATRQKEGPSYG